MRRWSTRFLAVALALTCTACGGPKEPVRPATPPPAPSVPQQVAQSPQAEPSAAPDASPQPSETPLPPASSSIPEITPSPQPSASPAPVPEEEAPSDSPQQEPEAAAPASVDLDLTVLSSTMVYAEVSNMLAAPDDYIGKTVRMKGTFSAYQEPDTQKVYCGVVVQDATACCSQGFDLVMPSQSRYPDDYPAAQSEVTVVGTIQVDRTLEDYGILTLRLEDIRFE